MRQLLNEVCSFRFSFSYRFKLCTLGRRIKSVYMFEVHVRTWIHMQCQCFQKQLSYKSSGTKSSDTDAFVLSQFKGYHGNSVVYISAGDAMLSNGADGFYRIFFSL